MHKGSRQRNLGGQRGWSGRHPILACCKLLNMSKRSYLFEPLAKTIKRILEPSKDISSTAPVLLEAVANCLKGEWAAYWKVNSEEHVLRAIATWSNNSEPLKPLLRETETRALTLSEGAPGRVWNSEQPLCTTDLVRDMRLPRSLYAKAAGFSSGLWFPIRYNQATCGVIESLGQHSWPGDQHFFKQLMILGEIIGETLPEGAQS